MQRASSGVSEMQPVLLIRVKPHRGLGGGFFEGVQGKTGLP